MRLHHLTLTAFGPFAGTERIDFDALSCGGLFLLHGATGAGKTSILDAVCFALYGQVPGARQGNPLRSDHAPPGTVTEVVLDLTVGGRRLEITRRPAYHRPKKKGQGTTQVKAQTLLREWKPGPAGGWSPVSAAHDEIGEEIVRLLGMSREQFCQVVLLPQGDFARFLRGDAAQRAAVLGRLFDTGRFAAVEKWLAERRRRSDEAARAAVDEVLHTVHRLHQAAGSAEGAPAADGGASWPELVEQALETAARLRVEARERRTHARLAQDAAEQRHQRAARALEETLALADRQARHARAAERSRQLAAHEPEATALAERLERARQAAALAPLLDLARAAHTEHHRARAAEEQARRALGPAHAAEGAAALTAAEARIREELVRLEEAARAEEDLRGREAERARLQADVEDAEAQRDDAARWLDGWPARHAEAAGRLERAQAAGHRAAQLADRAAAVREQRDAAREAERLRGEITGAEEHERTARDHAAAARTRWLDVRERRLDGMAAELAEHLADGQPCPVCGSPAHPAPARPAPGRVTRADEQAAEGGFRAREQAHEDARETLRRLREQAAAASAASGGTPLADLEELAATLARDHAAAQEEAAAHLPARQRMEQLEAERARRLDVQRRAGELLAARTARIEDLDRERQQLTAALAAARGTDPTITARVARLRATADRLAAAATAARTTEDTAERAHQAAERARAAVTAAGFATPQDATAALLDDTGHRELRQRLDAHRAERGAVLAALAEPDLAAAAARPPADPGAAQRELDAATAHLRQATATAAARTGRCAELDALGARLAGQARRVAPLLEEHATARHLADLAAGTAVANTLRMRLESYVLAARLEQVAAAASVRLERMSGGRYTLVHSDIRASGTKRSGLGLQVVDAWTGTARDTATLSGGESFFASLALALGLADVVSQESGGARLDTLFIDEGFGSLDPATLDNVLDVLDTLRERDRSVGIVSHVPELRQRIPTQLRVDRGRRGSTVRVTVPGG
jgi:DNA repair protein SbcC/Rad50